MSYTAKNYMFILFYILPLPRTQRKCDDYDDDDDNGKMTTSTPPPPSSCLIHCQTSIHFAHMHYIPAFVGFFFHMIPSGMMDRGFTVYT